MNVRREVIFWVGLLGALGFLLWLLRDILLPFVLGMAVGYLLDPVVERLSRWGLSRAAAAGLLVLAGFGVGFAILVFLVPALVGQAVAFARQVPGLVAALQQQLEPLLTSVLTGMRTTPAGDLTQPLNEALQKVLGSATGLVAGVM